ncbi:hypothetical protein NJH77_26235 [Serratia fonticola]|uniref:hypothetical protein n=1 Tax=Serratia fonticola TaxID=47917 RepID=UPI00209820EB|nr:hypothetical protein [Serratia fonticola]MCO7512744.1 hypothetical protein [Serratia fonticola]
MQRPINKVSGLLMGMLITVISNPSWAALTVTVGSAQQLTVTVPVNPPAISAGVDVPVGTVLYQGNLNMLDTYYETKWTTQLGWGESAQAPMLFNFSAEQSVT